jgi:alanyl-tRNA synthetase
MTQRLYYTDSYLRQFDASVTDRSDESKRIYLDRTAFYPTSGGQPFDRGLLNGVEVIDVVDEGDRVAHLLATPLSHDRVVGRVDWGRRFDHMQQHSGQHLLSAVLADQLGQQTTSVHFGRESSTLDLATASLSPEQVQRAEERANEIIVENRSVEVTFEDAELATGLRKVPDRKGELRIVTIRELDRSACGGTHVRSTAEIGCLLIRKLERVRQGTRLEFLCGLRATRRARSDYNLLGKLANDLSAAPEELPDLIARQREELKAASAARRQMETNLDLYRARELYATAATETTGLRRVIVQEEQASLDSLRGLAQAFTSMPKAVFVGSVPSPPALILAASADTGIDAAGMLKSLLASVGGRGGGTPRLAQGIVPGRAQLQTIIESLGSRV